jgi:hypothetical protein
MMLQTERATRGARRAFVCHQALLADWTQELSRLGVRLKLPELAGVDRTRFPHVDDFVDPELHRHRARWDMVDVPVPVRDLAQRVWELLEPLAENDMADDRERRVALDEARAAYAALYADAEAIAQSSVTAAKRRPAARSRARPSLRARLARRVPVRYRRRLRRAMRSVRRS